MTCLSLLAEHLDERMRRLKVAQRAEKARAWFESYGDHSAASKDAAFEVYLAFAKSCTGSTEASGYLERAALALTADIFALARRLADSDIEAALASGIETEGQDPAEGLGAEHESPTAEGGDAQ